MWDEADYVVPPAENGAFFVATNVVVTPNQKRGKWCDQCDQIGQILKDFGDRFSFKSTPNVG